MKSSKKPNQIEEHNYIQDKKVKPRCTVGELVRKSSSHKIFPEGEPAN